MGSSISRIYDDFESYQGLCEVLGVPENFRKAIREAPQDSFYKHAEALMKDPKYKDKVNQLEKENSYLYHKFKP